MAYHKYTLTKTGSMTKDIHVYTEFKENWQYFFTQPTMTPAIAGSVDKLQNVKQHTRQRGPGAPTHVVKAHTRYYARNQKTKGSARPGNPYIVGEKAAGGQGWRERRQFAIEGNDMDILAYMKAKAKYEIHVMGPNGWTTLIEAAAGGGALSQQGGATQLQSAVTGVNP